MSTCRTFPTPGWDGPPASGIPETGTIFAQGVCGHFQCIDARTGQTRWYVPLHERFGLLSTYGGRTNFPVICEDLVIVSGVIIGWGEMAKPAHRLIAFDKRSGRSRLVQRHGGTARRHDLQQSHAGGHAGAVVARVRIR